MPRVTQAHRAARRDEIVDAAARCFAASGYSRTSMSTIIDESGLSAGAIYGYFTGKRDLFLAVVERMIASRAAALAQRRGAGPALAPAEIALTLMRSFAEDAATANLLVHVWAEAMLEQDIRGATDEIRLMLIRTVGSALVAWFDEHPEPGRTPQISAMRLLPIMMSLGQGYLLQRQLFDAFDEAAYFEAVAERLPS